MSVASGKVIITCAVTGSIHTPTLSEALPYRPADIAAQALEAAEAGASVLHLHARDPKTGAPTGDPKVFAEFLAPIHAGCDAVLNLTTGGSPDMSVEERLKASLRFAPEICSLNMGSMNFAFHQMGRKVQNWKFDWEQPYIENSEAFVFRNSFRDIARICQVMGEFGTKFEHECYDIGHLYNLAYFVDLGLVRPPFWVQGVFGILGGIGADPDNVMFMRRTADRLFGKDYVWSVLAAGKSQMAILTQAALMGGHVRVGLEDSLYIGKGKLASSNAEQVRKIRTILEEQGLDIATPAETREMLVLKGRQGVRL